MATHPAPDYGTKERQIHYECLQPHPALSDVVESIWIQDDPRPAPVPPSCVVPTGTAELLFHYADPFVHVTPDGCHRLPKSYVTGQRSLPVFPLPSGAVGIVIVCLYPWALTRLFHAPPCLLVDGYVDLGDLLPRRRVDRLEEDLALAQPTERVGLVEAFLTRSLRVNGTDRTIRAAATNLAADVTPSRVDEVARALEFSPRHFRRRFQSTIGLRPKTFQRIMRFQDALRRHRHGASWSAVAAACGFADQAHLIREIKAFTGRTPSQIVRDRRQADEPFYLLGVSRFFDTVYL